MMMEEETEGLNFQVFINILHDPTYLAKYKITLAEYDRQKRNKMFIEEKKRDRMRADEEKTRANWRQEPFSTLTDTDILTMRSLREELEKGRADYRNERLCFTCRTEDKNCIQFSIDGRGMIGRMCPACFRKTLLKAMETKPKEIEYEPLNYDAQFTKDFPDIVEALKELEKYVVSEVKQ